MAEVTWTPNAETPKVFAELSGDRNPVHLDPEHARGAGFSDVIVHGMCTLGAAARAAALGAPVGAVMHGLDVRFANPVLPGEEVTFSWTGKEKDGALKVQLTPLLPGGRKVISPANFTYGAPAGRGAPAAEDVAAAEGDVAGEPFAFGAEQLAAYGEITAPSETVDGERVPPMVALLGMTGALEVAFRSVQPPEKEGTWVHLRQGASFFEDVRADERYRCRIQGARNVTRESKQGVMVTIPFVVERDADAVVVAMGSCGLLYAFGGLP